MREQESQEILLSMLSGEMRPVVEQITARMPNGFFVYHADGNEELIFANRALIQMFGCENLEDFKRITGFVFRGLVHPDDWERVSASIHDQIVEGGGYLDYVEYRIICKNGDIRWVKDFGHFMHTDIYGDIFYVFLEDATEQRLKEVSEERTAQLFQERATVLAQLEHESTALRLLHQILGSGMWSMEFNDLGEMVSVSWSSEFRAMLGYHNEADFPNVLESWSDLLHEEDRERVLKEYYDTISDYTGKKTYDVEYRLLTRDRGWRWFRDTGRLSRRADGTPTIYVGMFVDITHRKMTDEALETQHRQLEEALAQSQRASRSKSLFLSNMSHDIRTPMNAIVGFTTLASMYIDDKEMLVDYLDKIMTASNSLLALINDVLDMSRIENGEVQIEEAPCDLTHILRDLEDMVRAEARAKELGLTFRTEDLVHKNVVCDRRRLNQVLMNVLSNALKFTPSHGMVSVRLIEIQGGPKDYGFYTFKIRDTGIGMSPEFVEHIFEPFERERTSTLSGTQGAGLGMTITKNIVDMMHGTIRVESEPGKGSEVTISLPFRLEGV